MEANPALSPVRNPLDDLTEAQPCMSRLVHVRVLPRRGIINRSGRLYCAGEEAEFSPEDARALIDAGLAETVTVNKNEGRPAMTRLVRFDPFRDVAAMQNEMSRLLGAFREANGSTERSWVPALDVWETEHDYVYAFDLPGIPEDQISVEFEDGMLTVSAERERSDHTESDRFYRYERRFGSFTRTLGLPQGVKSGDISAVSKDGVLEIHVNKPEEIKPQRIQIGVGTSHPQTIEGTASKTD